MLICRPQSYEFYVITCFYGSTDGKQMDVISGIIKISVKKESFILGDTYLLSPWEAAVSSELPALSNLLQPVFWGFEGPDSVCYGNSYGDLGPSSLWSTFLAFPAYRDIPWGISVCFCISWKSWGSLLAESYPWISRVVSP